LLRKNPAVSKTILALDPGYFTGWVFFQGGEQPKILLSGILAVRKGTWTEKTWYLTDKFKSLLASSPVPDIVVCELPEFWQGSDRGDRAATRGFLVELAYLVGCYAGVCCERDIEFKPVEVRRWKGQMSKDACDARIKRRLGLAFPNHIADAVGLAMFEAGIWSDGVHNFKD
jgi:hypothetical protein